MTDALRRFLAQSLGRFASLARAARNTSGLSVIEFAIVAPIVFVLLFGIIETGLIYFAQSDLQQAVNYASRLVRTGQAQSQKMTASTFRTALCNKLVFVSCSSSLQVDMTSYGNFSSANFPTPLNSKGQLDTSLQNYQPGQSGQIVLLRAMYPWQVTTPLLTYFLVNMAGNSHLVIASVAFRNEPF